MAVLRKKVKLKTKDLLKRSENIEVCVKMPKIYFLRVYLGFFLIKMGCRCLGCKFVQGELYKKDT